jgi:aspartate kinase
MLIVKKYGGSSVATAEKIKAIAQKMKAETLKGNQLIIIVSAMGDTTDHLVGLSREITQTPSQRELDMLLSSGERISMALMAMALQAEGLEAISFTGSQSGVMTDSSHSSARILEIKPIRVKEEIQNKKTVIIAGFQGVDPKSKEVTTLGRGGSDTTAVAVAAHFNAYRCDILTDVKGLYTCDPRIAGTNPHFISELDYHTTLEMAYWGARVLHYRSVELAERKNIPVRVSLSSDESSGTLIHQMENVEIKTVNYNASLLALKLTGVNDLAQALALIAEAVHTQKMPAPQLVYEKATQQGRELFLTAPEEQYETIVKSVSKVAQNKKLQAPTADTDFSSVTLTGRGLVNSVLSYEIPSVLQKNEIQVHEVVVTPLSLTFIVKKDLVQKAAKILHEGYVK